MSDKQPIRTLETTHKVLAPGKSYRQNNFQASSELQIEAVEGGFALSAPDAERVVVVPMQNVSYWTVDKAQPRGKR